MGSLAGEFGGGPTNGARFSAQGANILMPTTVDDAQRAKDQAVNALGQQAALAQALQGQGEQGMASQSQLTQALQQQAAGGGPNPAADQLAQQTGANVANQAALMAGQRGANANVGLMARQAAQQGAATQQQAVGQGATMQAQQQLAAQQQLQNLAATQLGQQSGAVSQFNQAAQGEQSNILNSINAENNANVTMQSNINNANAGMAQTNANNSQKMMGSIIGAAGAVAGMAHGGTVPDGFYKSNPKIEHVAKADRMPLPDHIKGMAQIYHPHFAFGGVTSSPALSSDIGSPSAIANVASGFDLNKKQPKGPAVTAQPISTTSDTPTAGGADSAQQSAMGADPGGADAASGAMGGLGAAIPMMAMDGGKVPGKAVVRGDSPKNDIVDAKLSPGEIVIPRHIVQGPNPIEDAKAFVAKELAKHGHGQDEESDFKEAVKKAIGSRKKS